MLDANTRQRRTHSQQLKSEVVAACTEPGASVAAIALARGLNTNLVHKWCRLATRASSRAVTPSKDDAPRLASVQDAITGRLPGSARNQTDDAQGRLQSLIEAMHLLES